MVVIERAGSFSSSTSSRKEKQSRSSEKDINEVVKKKLVRKTSSSSSPSSPSKKGKQSVTCLKDNHELLKSKLGQRASSFSSSPSSSPRKGKQNLSTQKDSNNNNELHKEKPIRKASLLSSSSTSSHSSTKKSKSTTSERNQKNNSLIKSKVKELAPICKKRKEILNAIRLQEDIDVYLNKQIEGEGKVNPDDCLWLSSGSLSPQEFGLFMSALDPSLDEWVLSFLPRSSKTPNAISTSVGEAKISGEAEEEEVVHEEKGSSIERSQSIESSSCSSSLALSSYTDSSTFWNMDRTGVWVSLINDVNQNGDDSKFISNVDTQLNDLESNFPCPNYDIDWDSYSSDVGVSSSARSTQETASQSEWSSDLLSDSTDWELDSDDPIFWPFGGDYNWDHEGLDSFSISPRKGVYKIRFDSGEDVCVTPDSIRFRLHGKNGKRILFMSGLSASKIIEFKKGCRKNAAAAATAASVGAARGKRFSKIGKRASRYKRRVPPILENDLEGISPKDTPKESLKKGSRSSDIDLSECTDNWGDEMDTDGPLVWPTDQKTDWNPTWDPFNISPRKTTQITTNLSSPKGGFTVSSSVRLKFRPKKMKSKAICNTKSGLGTSKSSMFKSNNALFKHGRHGKKNRDLPVKVGKSVKEFIRLVSLIGMNKMFPGNEQTSEDQLPIETLLGLTEFDGHEGVDMEFEDEKFSLEECMMRG